MDNGSDSQIEWEIYNRLRKMEEQKEQLRQTEKELRKREEEDIWLEKRKREVNEDILYSYSKDTQLLGRLYEQNDILQYYKNNREDLYTTCRNEIEYKMDELDAGEIEIRNKAKEKNGEN